MPLVSIPHLLDRAADNGDGFHGLRKDLAGNPSTFDARERGRKLTQRVAA